MEFTQRNITSTDLLALREKISQWYLQRGYINSGAVIPDQDIDTKTIHIQIVEGSLEKLNIRGNHHLNSVYIQDVLYKQLAKGLPLNIQQLQQGLLFLQRDANIESVHARLGPGQQQGQDAGVTSRRGESISHEY